MLARGREVYEFGPFRLDVDEHLFQRSDGRTNGTLPEKAFRTLVVLVRNQGKLVKKDDLMREVWNDTIVEENSLDKCIHVIRHALHDEVHDRRYIETVRKHGYRFVADATRLGGVRKSSRLLGRPTDFTVNRVYPNTSPVYDLYVRGKVKAGSENRTDTKAAIKLLEAAVAIDPYFAKAYAQLARAYNTLAFKFSSDSERKVLHENADVAIAKALELDPNLAEGHFARGLILWTNTKGFPHEQAICAYKRSIKLDPNWDETHHQLSLVYAHIGLLKEARQELNLALEINPNNTMARYRAGVYTGWEGEFQEALTCLKTVPSGICPMLVNRTIAEILIQTGRLDEAEELVDNSLSQHPKDDGGSFTSVKALLLAKAGKKNEATEAIERAAEIGKGFGHFHHTAYNIASAYSALNEPEQAVKWLEAAADDGFPCYSYFEIDPNLDNLRSHRRFIALMSARQKQSEHFKSIA